ncbi:MULTISPECIES: histidine kinase [unclassified Ekhidna]|jgi:two-component system LytT family sensor kinase|uniref:sensor histidine kinase n=1 Tax=unclassified Ekhidna TaxID=2632188 RepID=UPI0032DFDC28
MTRNTSYWLLQTIGWFMYGMIGVIIALLFYDNVDVWVILAQFFSAIVMLFATHLLRYKMKLDGWLKLKIKQLIVRLVPTLIILALLANGITTGYTVLTTDLIPVDKISPTVFLLFTFQTFVYFCLWTAVYLIIYFFRNYKKEEVAKWQLQTAVKDAELIALKAQINPHFLFNALNNIRALILEDHMKARDMVSHLSELLRYSIQFNDNEKVTVEEELEIVNKYLELESVHYESRLHYEVLSKKELNRCKIPPMLIQLMAENAIKHGISQVKNGGDILISVDKEGKDLVLEVSNTGKLKKNLGNGIGLRNATERIRILFDSEPDLELFEQGNMVRSRLKLPIEK